jgi:hypothetical protein
MATFSRKSYEMIARVINDALYQNAHNAEPIAEGIIMGLALAFSRDNERFDGKRFINACAGEEIPSVDRVALVDGYEAFLLDDLAGEAQSAPTYHAGGIPTRHYDMSDEQAAEMLNDGKRPRRS